MRNTDASHRKLREGEGGGWGKRNDASTVVRLTTLIYEHWHVMVVSVALTTCHFLTHLAARLAEQWLLFAISLSSFSLSLPSLFCWCYISLHLLRTCLHRAERRLRPDSV